MTISPSDEEVYPTYVVSYDFEGQEWSFDLKAKNGVEVSRRLRAIGMTGRNDGELIAKIPNNAVTAVALPTIVALRNLIYTMFRRK